MFFFSPTGDEMKQLCEFIEVDMLYQKLCQVQQSFRARLSPKPWRCALLPPSVHFPYQYANDQADFDKGLNEYDKVAETYDTCHFVDSIGSGETLPAIAPFVTLHDQHVGATQQQALA